VLIIGAGVVGLASGIALLEKHPKIPTAQKII
jgi:L-2-hydroxyglutarate oxidase LhgO